MKALSPEQRVQTALAAMARKHGVRRFEIDILERRIFLLIEAAADRHPGAWLNAKHVSPKFYDRLRAKAFLEERQELVRLGGLEMKYDVGIWFSRPAEVEAPTPESLGVEPTPDEIRAWAGIRACQAVMDAMRGAETPDEVRAWAAIRATAPVLAAMRGAMPVAGLVAGLVAEVPQK